MNAANISKNCKLVCDNSPLIRNKMIIALDTRKDLRALKDSVLSGKKVQLSVEDKMHQANIDVEITNG